MCQADIRLGVQFIQVSYLYRLVALQRALFTVESSRYKMLSPVLFTRSNWTNKGRQITRANAIIIYGVNFKSWKIRVFVCSPSVLSYFFSVRSHCLFVFLLFCCPASPCHFLVLRELVSSSSLTCFLRSFFLLKERIKLLVGLATQLGEESQKRK